jgi:nucleoside-diphosphate-sugar epimerase
MKILLTGSNGFVGQAVRVRPQLMGRLEALLAEAVTVSKAKA